MWQRKRLGIATAMVALAACGTEPDARPGSVVRDGDLVERTGQVSFTPIEGGWFVIVGDDGRVYTPIDLPEAFEKDGLSVRFTARLRPDLGSILMMGEIVELLAIESQAPRERSPS